MQEIVQIWRQYIDCLEKMRMARCAKTEGMVLVLSEFLLTRLGTYASSFVKDVFHSFFVYIVESCSASHLMGAMLSK